MKKLIKKIGVSILTLTLMFTISVNVKAETTPNTITVKRAEVLNDIVGNKDHGFTIFTTTDGKIIYCMDVDKKALTSGQTATLNGNGDAGLLYILQNGYPNKEITGNDNVDKYITQAAVWWYLDESKLSEDFKNATKTDIYSAIPKIKELVANAKSAKDTQVTPSMSVTSNSSSLTLTSDGKYYESKYISAALVGTKTYNVSVSGGTKNTTIVDESGNIGSTMNSSERFKIRIPATEVTSKLNLTVKLSAEGTVQKAKIYKPSDSAYQRVVGLYNETTNLSKTVTLNVTPKTTKHICEYTDDKYYGKDGDEVDKKTYEKQCKNSCEIKDDKYYGKDGSVVDEKTYNQECGHICEYNDGKYYGNNGTVVDETTYNQECGQEVVVPNTSSNISALALTLGLVLITAGSGLIVYRKKQIN